MRRTVIGSIIIALGVLMFMEKMGMVELGWLFDHDWKRFIVPAIVLLVGIKMVSSSGRSHHHHGDGLTDSDIPQTAEGEPIRLSATFSGNNYEMKGQTMKDIKVDAFMGGMKIDMRDAIFTQDIHIDVHTLMGGADLIVPRNIRIQVSSNCLIGGVGNHTNQNPASDAPTLYITASCFMGGVDLKN